MRKGKGAECVSLGIREKPETITGVRLGKEIGETRIKYDRRNRSVSKMGGEKIKKDEMAESERFFEGSRWVLFA